LNGCDDEALTNLGEKIVAGLGGAATGHSIAFGQLTVAGTPTNRRSRKVPRDDAGCRFVSFIDVTAVTSRPRKRFDVVYFCCLRRSTSASVWRAESARPPQVPSIIEVFPGADWFERECYDLYA